MIDKFRFEHNMEILNLLMIYLIQHKEIRFTQALQNLGINQTQLIDKEVFIVDNFYEEPKETLKRMVLNN